MTFSRQRVNELTVRNLWFVYVQLFNQFIEFLVGEFFAKIA
jgi:hypothetical protein